MTKANSIEELFGVGSSTVKAATETPNNILQDRYDGRVYGELLENSQEMRSLVRAGENETSPVFNDLLQDVWAIFYKPNPTLTPEERVSASNRINRPFVERLLEDPGTKEARLTTELDELASALATMSAGQKLREEIESREDLKEAMNLANHAALSAEGDGEESQQASELRTQKALEAMQGAARSLRMAVKAAVEAGKEETSQMVQALAGWGLSPGDLTTVPMDQRLELVRRLRTPNLKRMAELVGRFRNLARARQKGKIKHARDEIHSITVGSDLAHVLPVELAALRHPLRKKDFYRRLMEGQVLQYDLDSREPQGKGPMVVLVDTSGSMNGNPMDWAVATALALVDTAARQKRRAAVIFFDTRVHKFIEIEPGERNIEKFIDMANTGASGGTDYQPALTKALDLIEVAAYNKADVVMVTDGCCRLPDEFLKQFNNSKEARKFNVYTVLLGYQPDEQMKIWSDKIWAVTRLTEEIAGEIFEEVA